MSQQSGGGGCFVFVVCMGFFLEGGGVSGRKSQELGGWGRGQRSFYSPSQGHSHKVSTLLGRRMEEQWDGGAGKCRVSAGTPGRVHLCLLGPS